MKTICEWGECRVHGRGCPRLSNWRGHLAELGIALFVGLTAPLALAAPFGRGLPRPNIVILIADDLGYGELGCQGNPEIPTPNIDALAAGGVRFTQGYASAPYCSPSRAGLLTGRYQTRFGHELNFVGRQNLDPDIGLPPSEVTLAEALDKYGYATGMIGKWHLGGTPAYHPRTQGFDEFFGFLHEGHYYVPPPYAEVLSFLRTNALPGSDTGRLTNGPVVWSTHMGHNEPPYDAANPILSDDTGIEEPAYLTEALTREAVRFIRDHAARPFCLYLAYNAVHSPMQARPQDLERFTHIPDLHRRVFAGMLAALDESVGTVLATLRELNLEERTWIAFVSDNGGPTRELTSSNRPLRGGKGELWEGGIRVPFILYWKNRYPAGRTDDRPVITLDLYPTALAAARLPIPENLDGVNLNPFLSSQLQALPHSALFWRYGDNVALRNGPWKLVRQSGGGSGLEGFELFDLARDPGETRDLSAGQAARIKVLRAALDRFNEQMMEPRWGRP